MSISFSKSSGVKWRPGVIKDTPVFYFLCHDSAFSLRPGSFDWAGTRVHLNRKCICKFEPNAKILRWINRIFDNLRSTFLWNFPFKFWHIQLVQYAYDKFFFAFSPDCSPFCHLFRFSKKITDHITLKT